MLPLKQLAYWAVTVALASGVVMHSAAAEEQGVLESVMKKNDRALQQRLAQKHERSLQQIIMKNNELLMENRMDAALEPSGLETGNRQGVHVMKGEGDYGLEKLNTSLPDRGRGFRHLGCEHPSRTSC